MINELFSNQRYIGSIISFDEFFMVRDEKGKRSNFFAAIYDYAGGRPQGSVFLVNY